MDNYRGNHVIQFCIEAQVERCAPAVLLLERLLGHGGTMRLKALPMRLKAPFRLALREFLGSSDTISYRRTRARRSTVRYTYILGEILYLKFLIIALL